MAKLLDQPNINNTRAWLLRTTEDVWRKNSENSVVVVRLHKSFLIGYNVAVAGNAQIQSVRQKCESSIKRRSITANIGGAVEAERYIKLMDES